MKKAVLTFLVVIAGSTTVFGSDLQQILCITDSGKDIEILRRLNREPSNGLGEFIVEKLTIDGVSYSDAVYVKSDVGLYDLIVRNFRNGQNLRFRFVGEKSQYAIGDSSPRKLSCTIKVLVPVSDPI